jgi:hypothetical protein
MSHYSIFILLLPYHLQRFFFEIRGSKPHETKAGSWLMNILEPELTMLAP